MVKFEIHDEKLRMRLKGIDRRAKNPTKLWRRIHGHQQAQSTRMFLELARGGTRRGVTWPWYKPQYIRTTDGAVVPAEGGVSRLRAGMSARTRAGRFRKGASQDIATGKWVGGFKSTGREALVRGKLRPSGKRVTAASNLMRDTGVMAKAAAAVRKILYGGAGVEMETPVGYARKQQELRPFSFFIQEDATQYVTWASEELLGDANAV